MKIQEITKKQLVPNLPNLTSADPETSADEALKIMANFKIHHLLVFKGEMLAGIVSDRDIVSSAIATEGMSHLSKLKLSEVMRRDLPVLEESTQVREAISWMVETHSSALPIMKSGQVVGIVTESDMLRALQRLLHGKHQIANAVVKGETLLGVPFTQSLMGLLTEIGL